MPPPTTLLVALLVLSLSDGGSSPAATRGETIPLESFKVFKEDSGPVNYYRVASEGDASMIRAVYKPGLRTVVLDAEMPREAWQHVTRVSWRWRVHALPRDANDCGPGFPDSAASVFLAFVPRMPSALTVPPADDTDGRSSAVNANRCLASQSATAHSITSGTAWAFRSCSFPDSAG